ncbi:MAG: SPASM domain-containing protein [Selenomonadaceae bacterium]|nr:SPASM domain-containing protein [Selenomonadaceae bacterium]MBR4695872.1 SPASM domain-containing protein [Selenomonadaceae bacterium]
MRWSRYSRLFLSKRNGWLLYNSAAHSFLKPENGQEEVIRRIMENPDGYDFSKDPQLYVLLRSAGHLVEDGQDEDLYNILKMQRLSVQYGNSFLSLTVAITRACNFGCSYCYENNRTGSPMSEEVADKLVEFIQRHRKLKPFINWYGGEPLLAFPRIRYIHRKLAEEGISEVAHMITNGYLLQESVIGELNDLNIQLIQITLDGKRETHDARRCLVGGGKTFDVILHNIDALMASDYKGTVNVRVNVDGRNADEYVAVHELLRERYPKDFPRRIHAYPGFVHGDSHPDASCFFDSNEKGRFVADVYEKYGIEALSLFPPAPRVGCTLTNRNAFVVGPDGEVYKCWDDVGVREAVVGHIDSRTDWNMARIAKGMVAPSYLDSAECHDCFYFPICDGGCHLMRMKNIQDGNQRDVCSYFKHHLDEILELHYERKTSPAAPGI